jgi:hypothetical protein
LKPLVRHHGRDLEPDTVVGLAAAGRGVAPQLARDRPGIPLDLSGDRTDALALRLQQWPWRDNAAVASAEPDRSFSLMM